MHLDAIIQRYTFEKEMNPSNVNELLDFIKLSYVRDDLTITQYRKLYRELIECGATQPL